MKICDRCYAKDGSSVKATSEIEFSETHEKQDLCKSCLELIKKFIFEPRDLCTCPPKKKGTKKRKG